MYMNANIMNTQIFHLNKYDLKGHWRTKVYPILDFDKKNYMNANIMNTQIFHLNRYNLKGHWRSQMFIPYGWSIDASPYKLCGSLFSLSFSLFLSPKVPLLLQIYGRFRPCLFLTSVRIYLCVFIFICISLLY